MFRGLQGLFGVDRVWAFKAFWGLHAPGLNPRPELIFLRQEGRPQPDLAHEHAHLACVGLYRLQA